MVRSDGARTPASARAEAPEETLADADTLAELPVSAERDVLPAPAESSESDPPLATRLSERLPELRSESRVPDEPLEPLELELLDRLELLLSLLELFPTAMCPPLL